VKAVREHAITYARALGLNPTDKLDVYMFHCSRPSKKAWDGERGNPVPFIYISPSIDENRDQFLVFIKFLECTPKGEYKIRYCGSIRVRPDDRLLARMPHVRRLCGIDDLKPIRLVGRRDASGWHTIQRDIRFGQYFRMGSILQVTDIEGEYNDDEITSLKNTIPYSDPSTSPHGPVLGIQLYQQAIASDFTDVVFLSSPESEYTFRFAGHKNVLCTIPYFKTLFASGMRECQGTEANPLSIEVQVPPWIEEYLFRDFLSFAYLRDPSNFNLLTIEALSAMIRIGDYYGFEELVESATIKIQEKYAGLNDVNVLELLRTVDPLTFKKKKSLEEFLVDYIVRNFVRVAKRREFVDLFGLDIYDTIVDGVANKLSWRAQDAELYTIPPA
jgi:hypothetical protein